MPINRRAEWSRSLLPFSTAPPLGAGPSRSLVDFRRTPGMGLVRALHELPCLHMSPLAYRRQGFSTSAGRAGKSGIEDTLLITESGACRYNPVFDIDEERLLSAPPRII